MPDVRDKRVELILQQLQQLPTLPAVALKVAEVTRADTASVEEVVRLISSDPPLAAKILRLVHRADSGVRGEVTTLERAVVLLGFEAVRAAALAIAVFQCFGAGDRPGAHFKRQDFWKHCIAVACYAQLLAETLRRDGRGVDEQINPDEAFACGLLHDMGKVALDCVLPKSFDKVVEAADLLRGNIADVERTVVGLDHMVVGKRLSEQWRFSTSLRECIWLHGQAPDALPASVANPKLVNLITLADILARQQHMGYSGNYSYPVDRAGLMGVLGLDDAAVKAAQKRVVGEIEHRARAIGLEQAESASLYQDAMEQANRELGRVSDQLASRNRRLTIRARFFDALSRFQGELRPDSPPQVVLQAIGQTAVQVIGVSPVVAFSAIPGRDFAEVLLVDDNGETLASSVAECPPRLSRQAAGDGPVLPTGDELEWLLSDVSPRLGGDQRYWVCLEAEGACIGGVVWGAQAGESQRLSQQAEELMALAGGWSLALRTAQIREESRTLAEQLAETNRQLHSAQSELLRSRTLVSVGEMAAGAAHEMNNPLAVIAGRAQLLATQLSDPKMKHAATVVTEQAHRLSQIITDLMDFAKPQAARLVATELPDLVGRAVHEAKALVDVADRRIELTMGEVPPVKVDAAQVGAALVEVIDNAIQATDPGIGRIVIHAGSDVFSGRVVLTISDNGCGMDEQTQRRAFDPFFSSKPAGRRRGLGLAKALRWVEASGGSIKLESRLQAGTTVIVALPAAIPAEADEPPPRAIADG